MSVLEGYLPRVEISEHSILTLFNKFTKLPQNSQCGGRLKGFLDSE